MNLYPESSDNPRWNIGLYEDFNGKKNYTFTDDGKKIILKFETAMYSWSDDIIETMKMEEKTPNR